MLRTGDAFTVNPEDMGDRKQCPQPHRGVSIIDPTDAVIPDRVSAVEVSSLSLHGAFSEWIPALDMERMVAGLEAMK